MRKILVLGGLLVAISSISLFSAEAGKSTSAGLWHFDEGEGEIAKDSSGNGNNLKLFGATWAEGKKGKCLSFSGKSSYAMATGISDSLVSLGDEFTISAWIKPDYVYPKSYEIVNCASGEIGPGYRFFITYGTLMFRSGLGYKAEVDKKEKYWQIRSPKFKKGKIPEKVLKKGSWYKGEFDNRWYHLTVTYKDGTYRIYVDGSLAVEKKEKAITSSKNKNFYIGALGGGRHCFFKGLIDEVEILNRAKTGEEIIDAALMGLMQ